MSFINKCLKNVNVFTDVPQSLEDISFRSVRLIIQIAKRMNATCFAPVGAFSYFADRALRKQMRIMRSLSAQKVRSCFRCNLKLSGLRDQRRINRPSENRLGIPRAWEAVVKKRWSERSSKAKKKKTSTGQRKGGRGGRVERGEETERKREKDSGEEAKWERAERWDEKLDLQICLDYYEIARLPISGAQPLPPYSLMILPLFAKI